MLHCCTYNLMQQCNFLILTQKHHLIFSCGALFLLKFSNSKLILAILLQETMI